MKLCILLLSSSSCQRLLGDAGYAVLSNQGMLLAWGLPGQGPLEGWGGLDAAATWLKLILGAVANRGTERERQGD